MTWADGGYGLLTDSVAWAFTLVVVCWIVTGFVFEFLAQPPGLQYLAAAAGLDIGEGFRALLLQTGYLYTIALVAGNLYVAGDSALRSGSKPV